jgi:AcrR family transcriptional regulator
MTQVVQPAARSGRPRDATIDDRVLGATRESLVEHGWEATSVRSVAARAEVSRAAVLRRWPSKAHLALDAVLGATPDLAPFDGVDVDGWIRFVARASVEIFGRPEMRAAAPGLLAALRDRPELRDRLWRTFTTEPVAILAALHPGAPDDAELEAKALIVLAAGAALFAAALAGPDDTPALHRRVEELLLAGRART